MKRYLVFAFDDPYPSGGWSDFEGAFTTIEQAREAANNLSPPYDCVQIVDLVELKEIV